MAAITTEIANRRLRAAGWITIGGLTLLAALSWIGTVYRPAPGARVLLFLSLAFPAVFYIRAIRFAEMASPRIILTFAAVFAILGFVTLPFDSTDVFYYMAQGWHQAHYEVNPYSHVFSEYPAHVTDPMISSLWTARNLNPWLDLPLPYGFLFAAIIRIVAHIGRGNWWLTLALFDLLNGLAHVAISWLVWRISQRLRFGNPKRALFLYAWNPFVLAHSMGDLHNDVLMGLCVVLAVYFLAIERPQWVLAALVAGGLIKYIALALIPFAALTIFRMFGVRKLLVSAFWAIGAAALLSTPYILEAHLFKASLITGQMTESTGSLHSFFIGLLRLSGVTDDQFPALFGLISMTLATILWSAFVVFAGHELWSAWKRPLSVDRIVVRWTRVLAFILFLSSSQFYSWYIGMLLPLAVLGYESWVGRAVVVASAAHLFGFTNLKSKRIGYFLLCTLAPFVLTLLGARRGRARLHGGHRSSISNPAIALGARS